jgi:hypothetical protein
MPMGELTNRVYGELHFGFHYAAESSISAEIRLSVDVSKHVVAGRFVGKCHDVPKSYNTLSHTWILNRSLSGHIMQSFIIKF